MVLVLNLGGNIFYFGFMGQSGEYIVKYFVDCGVVCLFGKNIVEFVFEIVVCLYWRFDGSKINWNMEWRSSKEVQVVLDEIDSLQRMQSRVVI